MSDEQQLNFNLVESSRRKGKNGEGRVYRAVVKREKPLGTDAIIKECIESAGLNDSEVNIRRTLEAVLGSMVKNTVKDGRTRRIDGFFSVRLDIAGSFERPDAEFDPSKHELTINFATAKGLRGIKREKWPVNGQKRPFGKIDKVYSAPDGEIGKLKYGSDIVIEGHDLHLQEGDAIHLFIEFNRDPFGLGKKKTTYEFGCDVKENTDTRIVVAFPAASIITPEAVIGQPGQVVRFGFSQETKKGARQHGRRANVVFVA